MEGQVVSYRDDAIVQEFETEEEMLTAHKEQFQINTQKRNKYDARHYLQINYRHRRLYRYP